ncbi:MAG: MBL fold metallo-hydrolase [Planctomycetes bacterium]|nr:MBL fold metallo-hydrolase [Planctomycetota bacterium]
MALKTIPISESFFDEREDTVFTWLGMAGVLINTRGTIIFIDALITHGARPELCESGDRLLIPLPILSRDVPKADILCYTHADGDHFTRSTSTVLNTRLKPRFIAPPPVARYLREIGVEEERLIVARDFASFSFGDVEIVITPALHDHQDVDPWQRGDCCGFLVRTPDGTIWHPGDTRLIPELEEVKDVDVLFFDVAAVNAHLGPQGSARLAATSGARVMVAYHYGTFDLPPGSYGNCDPKDALPYVEGLPGEFAQPNPGEILRLPIA